MEIRFTTTPRLEELRDEVRTWLDEALPPEFEGFEWPWEEDADRWAFMKEFWLKVGAQRWHQPEWPAEYGGAEMSPRQAQVVRDEFTRRRAGGLAGIGASVAPAIFRLGDDAQKAEFLPGCASGEIMWAEGYTEPDAGSDLASLRTRAVLDGDEWVVNGEKTFCTAGHFMPWIIIAARTDPDASKKSRGITYFLAPTDTPGLEMRPLYNIGYGRQNQVFLDDVRVPSSRMLGDLNEGWSQVWFGLGGSPIPKFTDDDPGPELDCDPPPSRDFHSSMPHRLILEELIRYCQQTVRNGRPLSEDPVVRLQLAQMAVGIEVERVCQYEGGRTYGPHLNSALTKEFQPVFAQTCMEILGEPGQVVSGDWAPLAGEVDKNYRQSYANHGGGTPQIKRMVVATRVLGLPR
jgi:alkylation response protein AidB-like acyl-CoA dehydrogenase